MYFNFWHFGVILSFLFMMSDAWIFSPSTNAFVDISGNINVALNGYMTAFGDFNADRAVDIFVLDKLGDSQKLDVILMAKENTKDAFKRLTLLYDNNSSIRNVVVGDVNGDSNLDVITFNSPNINGPYSLNVAYGVVKRDSLSPQISIGNVLFKSQPLYLDWNTDMTGDFFGETETGEFRVLIGNRNNTFSTQVLSDYSQLNSYFDSILYSYFVDINQNTENDILLVGRKNSKLVIIGVLRDSSMPINIKIFTIQANVEIPLIGQPVIADFAFDGTLQMIIPICMDTSCQNSQIITCKLIDYQCFPATFSPTLNGNKMGFQYKAISSSRLSLSVPELVPMSCGDVKMTGYIGCLVNVYNQLYPGLSTTVRLNNQGNNKFELVEIEGQSNLFNNVTQVAIFDVFENGILDILTTSQQGTSGIIRPLVQDASGDSYFIKVMTLNGLCGDAKSCTGDTLPFGIPLPGIVISYSTEGISGNTQSSVVSMVSTSSYTSLMLPYAFFGLSTFSNYIEKLKVQLYYEHLQRSHVLNFIVPKTQIVVIPYSLDSPSKWKYKLYLEPFHDRKVIYVAAALLGTMFIVSIILCILQYLEVREDRLEKMQEAQKFNFDAM